MPKQPQDRKPKAPRKSKPEDFGARPGGHPEDERYAPSAWGQTAGASPYLEMEVPSGQTCLVRRPGVEGLVKAGVLHDLDTLTSLVDRSHIDRVDGRPSVDTSALAADPAAMENMLRVVDKITCYVVVQPEVEMAPDDVTLRVPGTVYTDMVEFEDKMFLLNYAVGGQAELEPFRP